jgi:Spy/CpxP family protein refolding chaperone
MAVPLKIVLTVSGIFIAGAVTGGFVGFRLAEYYAPKPPRGIAIELVGGRLADQLQLTPEQKQQARPIIGHAVDELKSLSRDAFARSSELVTAMDKDLASILTPEQANQLKEMRAREDERRRQWLIDRAKRSEIRTSGDRPTEGQGPDQKKPRRGEQPTPSPTAP